MNSHGLGTELLLSSLIMGNHHVRGVVEYLFGNFRVLDDFMDMAQHLRRCTTNTSSDRISSVIN